MCTVSVLLLTASELLGQLPLLPVWAAAEIWLSGQLKVGALSLGGALHPAVCVLTFL